MSLPGAKMRHNLVRSTHKGLWQLQAACLEAWEEWAAGWVAGAGVGAANVGVGAG